MRRCGGCGLARNAVAGVTRGARRARSDGFIVSVMREALGPDVETGEVEVLVRRRRAQRVWKRDGEGGMPGERGEVTPSRIFGPFQRFRETEVSMSLSGKSWARRHGKDRAWDWTWSHCHGSDGMSGSCAPATREEVLCYKKGRKKNVERCEGTAGIIPGIILNGNAGKYRRHKKESNENSPYWSRFAIKGGYAHTKTWTFGACN